MHLLAYLRHLWAYRELVSRVLSPKSCPPPVATLGHFQPLFLPHLEASFVLVWIFVMVPLNKMTRADLDPRRANDEMKWSLQNRYYFQLRQLLCVDVAGLVTSGCQVQALT